MSEIREEINSIFPAVKRTLEGLGIALEGAGYIAWQASKLNYFADALFKSSRFFNQMAVKFDDADCVKKKTP